MRRHMDTFKPASLISLYLIGAICCCGSVVDAAWYQGCHVLPTIHTSQRKNSQLPNITPAKCAKQCLGKYRYAFLHAGYECLCHNSMTRRTDESNCYKACSGDDRFRCGGGRFASVYNVNGPYIASVQFFVEPTILIKNEQAKITIKVELASDARTRIGIKRYDAMTFSQVTTTIRIKNLKTYRRSISIRGRKGELSFTHAFDSEDDKYIVVTAVNNISSVSVLSMVPVTTKDPKSISIQILPRSGFQPTCAPDMDHLQSLESVVFTGERLVFKAIVEHGFNITFIWDFCGTKLPNASVNPEFPNCERIQCSDMQEFTFNRPGICHIRVRVYNDYGTVESVLNVSIIVPELRDLTIKALPQEDELHHDDTSPAYDFPDFLAPWEFQSPAAWNPGGIEEGGTDDGRTGINPFASNDPFQDYQPDLFPFLPRPSTNAEPEEEEVEDNHTPLEEGQYLMGVNVTFKALAFMTSSPSDAKVKVDFGDGESVSETLSKDDSYFGLSESRMRRSVSQGVEKKVMGRKDKLMGKRNKRSVLDSVGPYSQHVPGFPPLELAPRSGLFQLGGGRYNQLPANKAISITPGNDCLLNMTIRHTYKTSGKFVVTVKVFNGTHAISTTLTPLLYVLDGTPALNIRCPETIETGKSLILRASSTEKLPEILNWKILRQTDDREHWTPVMDKTTASSSFKKSFLVRGMYKVELVAPVEGLATSCRLQVEEALSGLSVNVAKTFVEIGDEFVIDISLESGSAVGIVVHFGSISKDAILFNERNKAWTARFRIMEPRCYDVYAVAKNPVSNLTSHSLQVCGEEHISGLTINTMEYGEVNSRMPIDFRFERGSNVTLQILIESLSGRKLSSYKKEVSNPTDGGVEILAPKISEPGVYKVVGRAYNHVPAKTETCDALGELTARAQFIITKLIKPSDKIALTKQPITREKDNQEDDGERGFVYQAKLNDELLDGVGILYRWRLQNFSGDLQLGENQILERFTSSPLFGIILPRCDVFSSSTGDVIGKMNRSESDDGLLHQWPKCKVTVSIVTLARTISTSQIIHDKWETLTQFLIRPQTSVIQSGKSVEFDVKCPSEESSMCEVSFGDGTEPMKIPSNANWNSLSHAFTEPGLFEVTLKSFNKIGSSNALNTTSVLVLGEVSGVKIEGTALIEYEESARGSWRVSSSRGSHKIYHWSVYLKNRTKIYDEYNREVEWEYIFQEDDEYIVRATVHNEISEESAEITVVVQQVPLHFAVETERSTLGKPSTFFVETNATANIVAVRYDRDGPITEYDLSCMKSNSTKSNAEDRLVTTYIITHKYNHTGSYEATFILLSREDGKTSKRLITLKTDVLHQPAPDQVVLEVINPNPVKNDGIYFVPSGKKVVIKAVANYPTKFFNWIVKKKRATVTESRSPTQAINGSTAEYTFTAERHTSYNVSVISFPKQPQSSLLIEAEDVITKVWLEEPFSEKERDYVEYCRLRRFRVNNTLMQSCDEVTLTAFSDGTHVVFYFYIRFRPEVPGDFTVPTDVVDIVSKQSTSSTFEAVNEVSIGYSFKEQGVYHISVTSSNNLGNKSAEIPPKRASYGMKPFLLYAQRPVPQIQLTQDKYYVQLNKSATFEIKPLNSLETVDIQWRMGDGTIKSGDKVEHTYTIRGMKELFVTATNFINKKLARADVYVEIPIESVQLRNITHVCSTRENINLEAIVYPRESAWNYTWYLTNDNSVESVLYQPYINHHFDRSDIYLVKVLAANGINAVESDPMEIEVQEPINAKLNGDSVVLKDKEIEMSVTLITGSEVSIAWMIDGGDVVSTSFTMKHVFAEIGTHTIYVILKNKLKTFPIRKKIFVDDHPCVMGGVEIVKGKRINIQIFRSKPLRLEAKVDLNCSYVAKIYHHWTVHKYRCLENYDEKYYSDVYPLPGANTGDRVLELSPISLEYGCYNISVNVTIKDSTQFRESSLVVQVSPSKLVPIIDGGTVHAITHDSDVTINASSTHDPDFPEDKSGFSFEWNCFILNSPQKSCFKEEEKSPDDAEVDSPLEPSPPASAMRAAIPYQLPDHEEEDIYKKFPSNISSNSSTLTFPASLLVETDEVFIFKLIVAKDERVADTTVVLKVETGHSEWVNINCSNCKEGAVPRHIPLVFNAHCATCVDKNGNRRKVTYKWTIHEVEEGDSESFLENDTRNCAPPDGSGWMSLVGVRAGGEAANDTDFEAYVPHNSENATGLHPEDLNFTGKLPPIRWDRPDSGQPKSRSIAIPDESITEGEPVARDAAMEAPEEEGEPAQNSKKRPKDLNHKIVPSSASIIAGDDGEMPSMAPRGANSNEFPEENQHPQPTTSTAGGNMRDGYGSRSPPQPRRHGDVEEGYTGLTRDLGFRPAGDANGGNLYGQSYRNGYVSPTGDDSSASYVSSSELVAHSYRNEDPSYDTPTAKHYQDKKHKLMDIEKLSLNGVSQGSLILRPNSLTEGKTYAVTVDVWSQSDNNDTTYAKGKSSFYFSILRGPGFGECTVLPRKKSTKNFKVYCMQWKNRQNGDMDISLKEMLRYEISYSMTKDGPKRHIYSGVSNDRYFDLPSSVQPEYIHIVVRNSDGASTNVCSFPQNVTAANETLSATQTFETMYTQAVGTNSKLSRTVAKGDKEEIISFTNVILDTLLVNSENQLMEVPETMLLQKVMFSIIKALNSVRPSRRNEVIYVLEGVTRALSHEYVLTAGALFEASEVVMDAIHALKTIFDSEPVEFRENSIFTDVKIMELLVLARYRISIACKQCANRVIAHPNSEEVSEAKMILGHLANRTSNGNKNIVVRKLVDIEKEVYASLNSFCVGLSIRRPEALKEIRSEVDGHGIVIQRHQKSITIFEDDAAVFGKDSGRWKVGAMFPDVVSQSLKSELANSVQIGSTLPDLTLANFEKDFIENRPLFLGVYKNATDRIAIRNLRQPIIIALPPRRPDGTLLKGIVGRDRVAFNSFSIFRRPNRTLHVEVILSTEQKRYFPVTVAITDEKTSEHEGILNSENIISLKRISRVQFQNFNELNSTIAIKFALEDKDFRREYGTYYVSLWNEQAMTSRSRHYDIDAIPYTLRIWWSDCFYWDAFRNDWKQDGVKVLDVSTSTQTLCSTTHLTSFSSSYLAVDANAHTSNIGVSIEHTGLRGSVSILTVVIVVMLLLMYVRYRLLRPRDVETPTSSIRIDYYGVRPRFSEIGRRLRWFFGPDHKPNGVPIALHDNRGKHKQVYEVTIQTSCWPGSGTTSNVTMILYGEDGKYEARELVTPKTHVAREARCENGYSENDDYTGIDDELFITGSNQTFIITYPENLGPLWKLTLWHDHSGECPRWKLDYVTVRDASNSEKWHFPCYEWMALDRGARSLSVDLRPVYYPPSLYMQIGLKFQVFLINFSSICSLVASPGYGKLTRCQRIMHLFALFVTICGLTTLRYMLGWDIYSHDTNLPFIHSISVSWGLIIGFVACIIIMPAQLLLRCSKQDERISVTIEDATGSMNGLDFLEDYGPYQNSSSMTIQKPKQDCYSQPCEQDYKCKESKGDEIHECIYSLPSVEDAVYDWLELKAWSESKSSSAKCEVDKDHSLPEVRSIGSHNWHQSTNSLDEEIVRCMMSSSPVRKSRELLRDGSSPMHKVPHDPGDEHKKNFLSVPTSYCGSIPSPAPHHRVGNSGLKIDACDSARSTPLAMDCPELVPCEKLEPIPQEKNAPLPRGCRKVARCYYVIVCTCACVLTLCGSVMMIRLYDVEPWLECIAFSIASALVVVEGGFIVLSSLFLTSLRLARWYLSDDDLSSLLDDVFSSGHRCGIAQNSIETYTESYTFPSSSRECLSANDEILLEDARLAREIADRERARYLRHVKPMNAPPAVQQRLLAKRHMGKATAEWLNVILLLVLGIIVASVISSGYTEVNYQSNDVEEWFKGVESPPDSNGGFILANVADTQNRQSKFSYGNIESREDWLKWFKTILPECPKSQQEREMKRMKEAYSSTDYLLRDKKKITYLPKGVGQYTRYVSIGTPTLTIRKCQKFKNQATIPQKLIDVLNYTFKTNKALVPEMNAMLGGSGRADPMKPSEDEVIVYRIPSLVSKDQKMVERLDFLLDMIQNQPIVTSVTVDMILQNPYTNLYSQISAKTEFHNKAGFHNFGRISGSSSVTVNSAAISQRGVDRSTPDSSINVFYLCQILLLMWACYELMRALVTLTSFVLSRFTQSVCNPNENKCTIRFSKSPLVILDVSVWILAVICLVYSANQRSRIESIMPAIYGYESGDGQTLQSLSLKEVAYYSTRLATAYGMFNFILIIKLLYIARHFHGLPKIPLFAKKKHVLFEMLLILVLFWAVALLLAFIGYLIFSDTPSFSTYLRSVMMIVLSSVTLGLLPVHMTIDMATMGAKYGYLATTWFFLTVFISFRLILKGLLIAVYKKEKNTEECNEEEEHNNKKTKAKVSKKSAKESKANEAEGDHNIKIADLIKYNAQKIKFFAVCFACIVLRRDPSTWGLGDNAEFTSLGFPKSKNLTEKEKKKLGPSESFSSQATPRANEVIETKVQHSKPDPILTHTKYDLPSDVWLLEVETQIEEMYSRASALADYSCDEIPLEALARIFLESRKTDGDSCSGISAPSRLSHQSGSGAAIGKSETEVCPAKPGHDKLYVRRKRSGSLEGKPPVRRVIEQRGKMAQKAAPFGNRRGSNDKQANGGAAVNAVGRTVRSSQSNRRRGSTPTRKISKIPEESESPASPSTPKKIHVKRTSLRSRSDTQARGQDGRRFGWLSELDDTTDVSRASSSCLGDAQTPVPPLTAHNLARHNYHILSRTSSVSQGGSSQRNAGSPRQEDIPSTSSAVFEEAPETPNTISGKLWRALSSLKRGHQADMQNKAVPARSLRRSRTAAINPRDIPSVESLEDSDAESERTGKKSSASTSRLQMALKTTSAYRGFTQRRKTRVRAFDSGSQISSATPSGSPVSEMTSLPSGSADFIDNEDTFSIPGTVSDSGRSLHHFGSMEKVSASRNSVENRLRIPSQSEDGGSSDPGRRSQSQMSSSSRASKGYSRRSVPPKICEEETEIEIQNGVRKKGKAKEVAVARAEE